MDETRNLKTNIKMEQYSRHDLARDEAATEYANGMRFTEETLKQYAVKDFKEGWLASYKYFQSINTRIVGTEPAPDTESIYDISNGD